MTVIRLLFPAHELAGMKMPFTTEQFLELFRMYNLAVWPAQLIFYLVAFTAVFLAIKRFSFSGRVISILLALFWMWMAAAYHFAYFAVINKIAIVFGLFFIAQALIFISRGAIDKRISFAYVNGTRGLIGLALILFSLVIYPFMSNAAGHNYPYTPTFGLPCPTVLFTLGMLLLSDAGPGFFVIPLLWSLLSGFAAWRLGMTEDVSLVIAALITVTMLYTGARRQVIKNSPS
jgi:hypothetical protein